MPYLMRPFSLLPGALVFRFTPQPLRDALAVEVALDADALDVVARRRPVAVVESVLRRRDRARLLGDHPGEGVPRLVQMDVAHACRERIKLQVPDEGVAGELLAGEFRVVVPRP